MADLHHARRRIETGGELTPEQCSGQCHHHRLPICRLFRNRLYLGSGPASGACDSGEQVNELDCDDHVFYYAARLLLCESMPVPSASPKVVDIPPITYHPPPPPGQSPVRYCYGWKTSPDLVIVAARPPGNHPARLASMAHSGSSPSLRHPARPPRRRGPASIPGVAPPVAMTLSHLRLALRLRRPRAPLSSTLR